MELTDLIANFLTNPAPLWNNELVNGLVDYKLAQIGMPYSLTRCILQSENFQERTLPLFDSPTSIKIVLPSERLDFFYQHHGLEPLASNEFNDALAQVQQAIKTFENIPQISSFIPKIVSSIQLLKSEDPETDVSYSHPDVPFSIFISVGNENTLRLNLRIAESILHEAMHLKLTLIEEHVPLLKPFKGNLYFSPWRDEKRPARGVLHGLFVFKSLLDFFMRINSRQEIQMERDYINNRIAQIRADILSIKDFVSCPDLTINGATLTANLLPLN